VPLSKRFFAGGSDSLRGFERESVGPLDSVSGSPIGGQVFAVANIEARTKLFSSLELVLFGDIGNVWLNTSIDRAGADRLAPSIISDPFGTMRTDAGIGFRYLTPVGALRLEYGFNLRPREFQLQPPDPSDPDSRGQFFRESSGKFYFSIGESF
jgi:outer membrane protein assembly factor BamA